MKMLLFLFLPVAFAIKLSPYVSYFDGGITLMACMATVEKTGAICNMTSQEDCYCLDVNGLALVLGCAEAIGHNNSKLRAYTTKYCRNFHHAKINKTFWRQGSEAFHARAMHPSDIPDFNASIPVYVPLYVNVSLAKLYRRSYTVWSGNYDNSMWYGIASVGYWLMLGLISMVVHWMGRFYPDLRFTFNNKLCRLFRKYIALPAFDRRRNQSKRVLGFDFLIPSRLETLAVIGFFGLQIGVNAAQIYYVKNDLLFGGREQAVTRYVSDRTGVISTVLVSLLLLLGGRNNFLQWLTGWKFSTMMVFHRWVARVTALLAIIHSFGYTWIYLKRGFAEYAETMKKNYIIWGTVSTTAGGLLLAHSYLFFRRRWYEIFVVIHILLAVFFVVGLWYHVDILGYHQAMYPCFVVWFFDRLMRGVRLLWFGFKMAQVELIADETLVIEVAKPKYWPAIPGGHVWMHTIDRYFWQSHPFTFTEGNGTIKLFCKVKNGMTKRLAARLRRTPGHKLTLRIGVEGPYGEMCTIPNKSAGIFIAGGGGIPGIYSELIKLASRPIQQPLKLVWIIREYRLIEWFLPELQALERTNVEVVLYVTRASTAPVKEEYEKLDKVESIECTNSFDLPHVQFKEGRPDLETLVRCEIEEAVYGATFITCGHPALVDELRYHVVSMIDKTEKRVDFRDELQIWA